MGNFLVPKIICKLNIACYMYYVYYENSSKLYQQFYLEWMSLVSGDNME